MLLMVGTVVVATASRAPRLIARSSCPLHQRLGNCDFARGRLARLSCLPPCSPTQPIYIVGQGPVRDRLHALVSRRPAGSRPSRAIGQACLDIRPTVLLDCSDVIRSVGRSMTVIVLSPIMLTAIACRYCMKTRPSCFGRFSSDRELSVFYFCLFINLILSLLFAKQAGKP